MWQVKSSSRQTDREFSLPCISGALLPCRLIRKLILQGLSPSLNRQSFPWGRSNLGTFAVLQRQGNVPAGRPERWRDRVTKAQGAAEAISSTWTAVCLHPTTRKHLYCWYGAVSALLTRFIRQINKFKRYRLNTASGNRQLHRQALSCLASCHCVPSSGKTHQNITVQE